MRRAALTLALLAACAPPPPTAAPPAPPSDTGPIVIAVVGGADDAVRQGVDLAVERELATGGLGGREVEIVALDAGLAVETMHDILGDRRPVAVIGDLSPAALDATRAYSPIAIVCLTTCTAPLEGPAVLSNPSQDYRTLARYALSRGWRTAVVVTDSRSREREWLWFYEPFDGNGGSVPAVSSLKRGSRTFVSVVTKLQGHQADLVVATPDVDVDDLLALLSEVRGVGLTVPFLGGRPFATPTFISDPVADGSIVVSTFTADDPASADFVSTFHTTHGRVPDEQSAIAHDAGVLVLEAVRRSASIDPAAVLAAIPTREQPEVPYATGITAVTDGWAQRSSLPVIQVSGGATVFLERVR